MSSLSQSSDKKKGLFTRSKSKKKLKDEFAPAPPIEKSFSCDALTPPPPIPLPPPVKRAEHPSHYGTVDGRRLKNTDEYNGKRSLASTHQGMISKFGTMRLNTSQANCDTAQALPDGGGSTRDLKLSLSQSALISPRQGHFGTVDGRGERRQQEAASKRNLANVGLASPPLVSRSSARKDGSEMLADMGQNKDPSLSPDRLAAIEKKGHMEETATLKELMCVYDTAQLLAKTLQGKAGDADDGSDGSGEGASLRLADLVAGMTSEERVAAGLRLGSGIQVIHAASYIGDLDLMMALLDRSPECVNLADITANRTPLFFAAAAGQMEAVKLLLNRGADITITTSREQGRFRESGILAGHCLLSSAIEGTAPAPSDIAVQNSKGANKTSQRREIDETYLGHEEDGADDTTEQTFDAPIYSVLYRLLHSKSKPIESLTTEDGNNVLHMCALFATRQTLLRACTKSAAAGQESKPEVDHRLAPIKRSLARARSLARYFCQELKANPNSTNKHGNTPLHEFIARSDPPAAIRVVYESFARALIRLGANPRIRNRAGSRSSQLANQASFSTMFLGELERKLTSPAPIATTPPQATPKGSGRRSPSSSSPSAPRRNTPPSRPSRPQRMVGTGSVAARGPKKSNSRDGGSILSSSGFFGSVREKKEKKKSSAASTGVSNQSLSKGGSPTDLFTSSPSSPSSSSSSSPKGSSLGQTMPSSLAMFANDKNPESKSGSGFRSNRPVSGIDDYKKVVGRRAANTGGGGGGGKAWMDRGQHRFITKKREECFDIIMLGMKQYVDDLKILVTRIREPLTDVLDPTTVRVLFGDVREIYFGAEVMLHKLENLATAATTAAAPATGSAQKIRSATIAVDNALPQIAHIFIAQTPLIARDYVSYCVNLERALDMLPKLRHTNSVVRRLNDEISHDFTLGHQTVNDFLAKPRSWLSELPGMLAMYLESTGSDHPQYEDLEAALECVENVALDVRDKSLKMSEYRSNVVSVFRDQDIDLDGSDAKLVYNGTVQVRSAKKEKKERKTLGMFLFGKYLILGKGGKGTGFNAPTPEGSRLASLTESGRGSGSALSSSGLAISRGGADTESYSTDYKKRLVYRLLDLAVKNTDSATSFILQVGQGENQEVFFPSVDEKESWMHSVQNEIALVKLKTLTKPRSDTDEYVQCEYATPQGGVHRTMIALERGDHTKDVVQRLLDGKGIRGVPTRYVLMATTHYREAPLECDDRIQEVQTLWTTDQGTSAGARFVLTINPTQDISSLTGLRKRQVSPQYHRSPFEEIGLPVLVQRNPVRLRAESHAESKLKAGGPPSPSPNPFAVSMPCMPTYNR
eukprot:TRINITY_DN394_c0_g1_i1.p1 TRINITY_DN394_c0_g1~~TRINITY_DN394_c0_g1_i1.p1  ORF type:complete len:1328 (+),score=299.80 TRINITY_DN394_c0_g1_i1:427-4410(+)